MYDNDGPERGRGRGRVVTTERMASMLGWHDACGGDEGVASRGKITRATDCAKGEWPRGDV